MLLRPLSEEMFSSREKHSSFSAPRFSHTGAPSNVTAPAVMGIWAVRAESSVVFPAPLRPISP